MGIRAIDTGLLQFYDPNTGKPVGSGFVCTYDTISGAPKITYSDLAGTIENPNPVPLDATGSALIFGDGSFKFVVKNAAGVVVRTIDNIGISTESGYDASASTPNLGIGGGNNGFESGDYLAIYDQNAPHELVGFGAIDDAVLQANVDNQNVSGAYERVSSLYVGDATAVPSGALVFDGSQTGYDPASRRIYEFRDVGNFSVDPQADTNVSEHGQGDNYIDLFRMAAAEEMRVKRAIMSWEKAKNLIGMQTITYPVVVVGSNGKLYVSSGSPTAEQMSGTDPVTDTDHTVWAYVYDPTETAQFPPWYRSPNQGIRWNDTISIKAPKQACKMLDAAGDFVNDAKLTVDYFKSPYKFEFGAGVTGTPKGGFASSADNAATGWLAVYIIKTTGTDVDVCLAPTSQSISDMLTIMNGLPAEVAAGRTWATARRIAYCYCTGTAVRQFTYSGDGVYTSLNSSALGNINDSGYVAGQYAPPNCAVRLLALATSGAEDTIFVGYMAETAAPTNYIGLVYSKAGSSFADYGNTISVMLRLDVDNKISLTNNGQGSWSVNATGYKDFLED